MTYRVCNRCGESYRQWDNMAGKIELKHGVTEVTAHLCDECYNDILGFYQGDDP